MSLLNSRKDLADLLRECVSSFSLYDSSHFVQAHEHECGQIDVEYSSLGFLFAHRFQGIELHVAMKGSMGFVGSIRIPEAARGKGHGTDLMACAEEFLKKTGCCEIELTASGANKHRLYEKLGYVMFDEQTITMRKKL